MLSPKLKLWTKRSSVAVYLTVALSGCAITGSDNNTEFTQIAGSVMKFRSDNNAYGRNDTKAEFLLPNLSAEKLATSNQQRLQFLAQLDNIDTSALSEENQINLTILRAQVQNNVDEYRFHSHYMPLTSEYGFHSGLSFMISSHDFKKRAGYELYLARLQQVPRYFKQNIDWMKEGMAVGLTQPKAVLEGYESSIEAYIVDDVTKSEFYGPFTQNQASLPDAEFKALQQRAKEIIQGDVIAAYQDYLNFFVNEYRPAARTEIGISSTPNGEAFYANRAKYYTTTNMTPKEIHELGLKEVARIRAEMEKIIKKVGFKDLLLTLCSS